MNKWIWGVVVVALVAVWSCNTPPAQTAKAKTAVLVIASSEVQDTEFLETRKALADAGARVLVAAPSTAASTGMLGGSFVPDLTIDAIDVDGADLIAVIGGNGSFALWDNPDLIAKVQQFSKQGKIVAAICAASGVLAKAGLLNGLEATCYPYDPIINTLKDNGALYLDKTVVVAGKVVTGNGPDASIPFGTQLAGMIH